METTIYRPASNDIYNKLPSVYEANESVRRDGRLDRFLDDVGRSFIAADLASSVGVGLLHKHNSVEEGHMMSQSEGRYEEELALICAHTNQLQSHCDAIAPILYGFSDDHDLIGFEFSSDRIVKHAHKRLLRQPKFIERFQLVLREHGLQDYLGFSILGREFYVHNKQPGLVPVEQSDAQSTANIVRLRNEADLDMTSLIQTSWAFSAEDQSQCIPLCSSVCVMRSPGHSREHYPNHGMIA